MSDVVDVGSIVSDYARDLTAGQLAELIAIQKTALDIGVGKSPIMVFHFDGEVMKPMIDRGLVESRKAPKGWSRDFRSPVVTDLGRRAMLCRVQWELQKAGIWPKEYSDDE